MEKLPSKLLQQHFIVSFIISVYIYFLKVFYLFIVREGKGEKHKCVGAPHTPPTGDGPHPRPVP